MLDSTEVNEAARRAIETYVAICGCQDQGDIYNALYVLMTHVGACSLSASGDDREGAARMAECLAQVIRLPPVKMEIKAVDIGGANNKERPQ